MRVSRRCTDSPRGARRPPVRSFRGASTSTVRPPSCRPAASSSAASDGAALGHDRAQVEVLASGTQEGQTHHGAPARARSRRRRRAGAPGAPASPPGPARRPGGRRPARRRGCARRAARPAVGVGPPAAAPGAPASGRWGPRPRTPGEVDRAPQVGGVQPDRRWPPLQAVLRARVCSSAVPKPRRRTARATMHHPDPGGLPRGPAGSSAAVAVATSSPSSRPAKQPSGRQRPAGGASRRRSGSSRASVDRRRASGRSSRVSRSIRSARGSPPTTVAVAEQRGESRPGRPGRAPTWVAPCSRRSSHACKSRWRRRSTRRRWRARRRCPWACRR